MNKAIIIFVRNPELGKVKTRLAATVGNEKALAIYNELLQHTFSTVKNIKADKFVFYHEVITDNDIWSEPGFIKKIQENVELGEKMKAAFQEVFSADYKNVLIIGSDCLQLNSKIIEDAFTMLEEKDTVIGPAKDGGYYLLGMSIMQNFIFENKEWSTAAVFSDTIHDIEQHQLSVGLLPELLDVDTEEDWLQSKMA